MRTPHAATKHPALSKGHLLWQNKSHGRVPLASVVRLIVIALSFSVPSRSGNGKVLRSELSRQIRLRLLPRSYRFVTKRPVSLFTVFCFVAGLSRSSFVISRCTSAAVARQYTLERG